jgi:RNA polymerase sigma-70 factor (ECF subfamily)
MEEPNGAAVTNEPAHQPYDWARVVGRIAAGDEDACAELYSQLRGLRFFFARRLRPEDVEDRFHDVILTVIQNIRHGVVREPDRLVGYVHTIAQRAVAGRINALHTERQHRTEAEGRIVSDPALNPEMLAVEREKDEIAKRILMALPERDREVLIRFYLDGHAAERIQHEMGISETQFRLVKSRAKARFASLVKTRLAPRPVASDDPRDDRPKVSPSFQTAKSLGSAVHPEDSSAPIAPASSSPAWISSMICPASQKL